MTTWANERPFKGDLLVQQPSNRLIQFTDAVEKESVLVMAPDTLDLVNMTVMHDAPNTPGLQKLPPITVDDAKSFTVGSGLAERDVWHFVNRAHCKRLRAGLTVHRSVFSSTPHPFELEPEKGFEEVFYFLLPSGGKALLEGEGVLTDGMPIDAAWPVRDRTLAQVPMGYHRVVALADKDGAFPVVAYVWCYLCKREHWEKDR